LLEQGERVAQVPHGHPDRLGHGIHMSSLPKPVASVPVPSLEDIRPRPVKAGLPSDAIGLNAVITDAVIGHFGSVKAAALTLTVDPSLMMREFRDGKFGRLDAVDDAAKAAIAHALIDAFGPLVTPEARARKAVREIRRWLDDLDQYLEHAS